MSIKIYTIVWSTLVDWVNRSSLAHTREIAFSNALLEPFKLGYITKKAWQDDLSYKAAHTGQVIYLEKVLNEYYEIVDYDPNNHVSTKQIYINEGTRLAQVYFNERATEGPVYFNERDSDIPVYFNERATYENAFFHFTVNVPSALAYDADEMRSVVQFYINTKNFRILEI
jgi:hypothetical protein